MTLKQKIGQLFIHTVAPIASQKNKNNIETAIKEYGIGGLLFSRGNLHTQIQLTNYAQAQSSVPLFITFDGEWGLAMRLKDTPEFPRNRVLGCIRNDSLLYEYGREVARQCKAIGVQVNFAPVADVDNNPNNPVINVRSFGSDPKEVARKVVAYARGLEDGGVMAVCKHFPGHGDTDTDSHKALPELNFTRERLDSIELYPFRQAIESGVGGVMVGHLHVPELGEEPASISPSVITHTLKESLHFSGLVFTDALEMKGISANENVCAQALIAGNDLLLAPRNLKKELAGVMEAVHKGTLTEAMINEKCRKVLAYKYALGLSERPTSLAEDADRRLFTPATAHLIERLQASAVTMVKDSEDILPLNPSLSGTALLSLASSMSEAYPFYKMLHETIPLNWIYAHPDSIESLRARLRPVQRVIMAVHTSDIAPYLSLMESLATDKPVMVVCFSDQKTLQSMHAVVDKAASVILAHADGEKLQRYVANIILGRQRVDGRLSIDLDPMYHAGTGVILDPEHPRDYKPEDFDMDSHILAGIDSIALQGMQAEAYPGCHVLIMRNGYPVYNKHFGHLTYEGQEAVGEHTLYDLASVSKIAGTLLAVMKLYDEGRFGLTDKVSRYVPELRHTNKENITVQSLLYHESGLPAYWPFYQDAVDLNSCKGGLFRKKPDTHHTLQVDEELYACTDFSYKPEYVSHHPSEAYPYQVADSLFVNDAFRQVVLKDIVQAPLKGHSYRYSCLNFMLLKEMVERITRVPMDIYLDSVFYKPMGLAHTAYLPLRRFPKSAIAPTVKDDFLRGGPLQGFVHDEAAAFMGGVSGNAGLFSTARDVAQICRLLIDRGVYGDRRYLSRATCELFLTLKSKSSRRGLGFDKPDTEHPDKSPCTAEAPASVFGHTGFTGTCVWADPDNDLVYVFLSNRTYPQPFDHTNLNRMDIRRRIQQVMYQSLKK